MSVLANNGKRAAWARRALDAFAAATRVGEEDLETQLSDLLADLMHLADQEKIDWKEVERRASEHYADETSCACPGCNARGCPMDYEYDDSKDGAWAVCWNCDRAFDLEA